MGQNLDKQDKKLNCYHSHHIVPKCKNSFNGPDMPWNCILLTLEDHKLAHLLLFEVFGSHYDLCAYHRLKNQTVEGNKALQKANIEYMRENKLGCFNSEQQAKNGRTKKINRVSSPRLDSTQAALKYGSIWDSEFNNSEVIFPPNCPMKVKIL